MAKRTRAKVKPANPAPPSSAAPAKILYCSFCFKSQREVKMLIADRGAGTFICDECVELCNLYIAGRPPKPAKASLDELPTERLLLRLGAIEETLKGKGVEITDELTERDYGIDFGVRDPFGNQLRVVQLGATSHQAQPKAGAQAKR